jgi:hypothetical protein
MNKMRNALIIATLISVVMSPVVLCVAASLPSSILPAVAEALKRDFVSVEEIGTYSMSDEPDGQFDLVVVGSARSRYQGWRVEVWSVENGRLSKRWDSHVWATGVEFEVSGSKSVDVQPKGYDYDVVVEGCARHECADGISGFLVFSGKTRKTHKAKLITQGLDRENTESPKYDVTFSDGITDEAKKTLVDAICTSRAITNKQGLPFECKRSSK